jgi:hypothetical protein
VTPLYQEQIIVNPSLGKVIEKQLIFWTYVFLYLYEYYGKEEKNSIYYKGTLDLAGNIAGLATGASLKKETP